MFFIQALFVFSIKHVLASEKFFNMDLGVIYLLRNFTHIKMHEKYSGPCVVLGVIKKTDV